MEEVKKGKLFVVSGPSGAGKGAICAGLPAATNAMLSVSMTTRAPRGNEEEGKSYFFVDKDRFREVIAEDGFFENVEVYGEYYGTPKAPVLACLDEGRDVILEIEVEGAAQTKLSMPDAILVFVLPPSLGELRKRIESRGTETDESIARRLERVAMEIGQIGNYDYFIVNDDLEEAIKDMIAIMRAERVRIGADHEEIINKYRASDK